MDPRLQVTDLPRTVAAGVTAETPLVTIAWRALRAEHQRRAEELKHQADETAQFITALVSVAEEAHRLRRLASRTPDQAEQLLPMVDRLRMALASVGMQIIAPEGEPFTAGLMDLLENIAQQPHPATPEPRVAEVLAPTITYRGAVLRLGKAVITVPLSPQEILPEAPPEPGDGPSAKPQDG